MKKEKLNIIKDALEESEYLISEEYQSLIDDDLKERYDTVLAKLENALKQIKNHNAK